MHFDGSFCQAQFFTNALVRQAQHHESEHATLAFTQPQVAPIAVLPVCLRWSDVAAREICWGYTGASGNMELLLAKLLF